MRLMYTYSIIYRKKRCRSYRTALKKVAIRQLPQCMWHMEAKQSPWWVQAQLDDWGSEMKSGSGRPLATTTSRQQQDKKSNF